MKYPVWFKFIIYIVVFKTEVKKKTIAKLRNSCGCKLVLSTLQHKLVLMVWQPNQVKLHEGIWYISKRIFLALPSYHLPFSMHLSTHSRTVLPSLTNFCKEENKENFNIQISLLKYLKILRTHFKHFSPQFKLFIILPDITWFYTPDTEV